MGEEKYTLTAHQLYFYLYMNLDVNQGFFEFTLLDFFLNLYYQYQIGLRGRLIQRYKEILVE